MGALITGLSSLLQPAINSFVNGLHSHKTKGTSGLDSLIAQQAKGNSPSNTGLPATLSQLLSTLQQLQQSNPAKYQQVTGQIAINLQSAAQSATASGNTNAAQFLSQLSTDFSNASKNGQVPAAQDLAKALGFGTHHHNAGSSTGASSSSTTGQSLDQLLASLQNSQSQGSAYNPLSIINNALSAAGVKAS